MPASSALVVLNWPSLFGADPLVSGEVYLRGRKVSISSPADAASMGIGYLSEDRRHLGLALGLDVTSNVGITNYASLKVPQSRAGS